MCWSCVRTDGVTGLHIHSCALIGYLNTLGILVYLYEYFLYYFCRRCFDEVVGAMMIGIRQLGMGC